MKNKTNNASLIDKLKFLKAKSIQENPLILENILGVPIVLHEFSGTWEEQGIFIKEDEWGYVFLSRHYSNPDKNGRGNIILARTISSEDVLMPKDKSHYVIKFGNGGGAMIYDEDDLKEGDDAQGMKEGYNLYDIFLSLSGIFPICSE